MTTRLQALAVLLCGLLACAGCEPRAPAPSSSPFPSPSSSSSSSPSSSSSSSPSLSPSSSPSSSPPSPSPSRTLRSYLDDPRVAAPEGAVVAFPEGWREHERPLPPLPADAVLPEPLEPGDLPGDVDGLTEPDERLEEPALLAALGEAQARLRADPGNLQALVYVTQAQQLLGRDKGALQGWNRLVIQAPGLLEAHLQRGILLSDLFRFEEALASFDYLARLRSDWDLHLNRGIALCFAKEFEAAEWDLWRAVELNPEDGNAYWDLAWLYAQRGDAPNTVEMLRFAARDEELFSRRFTREKVRFDVFLAAVGDDAVFVDYTDLLPEAAFAPEPPDLVLRRSSKTRLRLPIGERDGVEPGSAGQPEGRE